MEKWKLQGLQGLYWDNGKENGKYRNYKGCIGLFCDNGKENGKYRIYRGYIELFG